MELIPYLKQLTFANPQYLWCAVLLPALIVWYIMRNLKLYPVINMGSTQALQGITKSWREYFIHLPFILRILALALMIVAMARPQSTSRWSDTNTEGIDMVVSLDVSTSMLAQDFKPNRLEASKTVAIDFVNDRPDDRLGLVIFSGEAFTQCPLTTDHAILKNMFSNVKTGLLADGTAIGMGLATAVNRLKDSKSKSRVIILMTDGVNNQGAISPETAAEIAKQYNIRVYTIGVGTKGKAYSPVAMDATGKLIYDYADVQIDEPLLKNIAAITGGKYFRATGNKKLKEVYTEIDKLEKTRFETSEYRKRREEFWVFAMLALLLVMSEFIIKRFVIKTLV
ncbi:MAG: VWA domain-containing protein [Bacteroidia bacterium]